MTAHTGSPFSTYGMSRARPGGFWKYALGGWSIAGISSFQSGAPFTVQNGIDRGAASNSARPDIGNPNAPLNSRAVLTPASGSRSCATGYRNPDTDLCVIPADVHWIQGDWTAQCFHSRPQHTPGRWYQQL